jgi:hypothetical protein
MNLHPVGGPVISSAALVPHHFKQSKPALMDIENHSVFTLKRKGELAGFSAFTPWGRGKKAEKPVCSPTCRHAGLGDKG